MEAQAVADPLPNEVLVPASLHEAAAFRCRLAIDCSASQTFLSMSAWLITECHGLLGRRLRGAAAGRDCVLIPDSRRSFRVINRYFGLLLIGWVEGLDAEHDIAWRGGGFVLRCASFPGWCGSPPDRLSAAVQNVRNCGSEKRLTAMLDIVRSPDRMRRVALRARGPLLGGL